VTKKDKPMLKSRPQRLLALALPVLGSLALSSAADANVRTTSQGSACQFQNPEDRGGLANNGTPNATVYSVESGIFFRKPQNSTSTETKPVVCTVPRNLPLATQGLSDLEIRFAGLGGWTTPKQVKCVAYSLRPGSEDWVVRVQKSVTVAGMTALETPYNTPGIEPGSYEFHLWDIHYATMDFGNVINASIAKGTYAISCDLPDSVALVSIYSSEEDGIAGN
jgi:hypothetical protein